MKLFRVFGAFDITKIPHQLASGLPSRNGAEEVLIAFSKQGIVCLSIEQYDADED
jgi:hypothetical protein